MKNPRHYFHPNREESQNFLRSALMWRGSVTARLLPALLIGSLYPLLLIVVDRYWWPLPHFEVTPFEYTGAVLGLVLVFRTNAGHDRWWEARKLWGSIVNASRNIMVAAINYGPNNDAWRKEIVKWTIAFSFAAKESLRQNKDFNELNTLLTAEDMHRLQSAPHMPLFVADKIAMLLHQARFRQELSELAFFELEKQRAMLIDCIGACERILKTPMPLVYAIKTRRFILIFLLLLPFSLMDKTAVDIVFIFLLVTYPLLSLDRIGLELQYPFDIKSLSHLPLNSICNTILANGLGLLEEKDADGKAGFRV